MIENLLKFDNEVEERRKLHGLMKTLQDENYQLRKYEEAAKANLVDSSVNETQLKNSLTKAYKDVVRKQSFLNQCLFICLGFYVGVPFEKFFTHMEMSPLLAKA